jgi:hypothetical protein
MEGIDEQQINSQRADSIYRPPIMDASILKYRLDTGSTLDAIQVYLEGKIEYTSSDKKGNLELNTRRLSQPKANQEGIHGIMAFVRSIISAPVVMGNFVDLARYDSYIYETHISLATMVAVNAPSWEIKDEDMEPITDTIMLLIQPFLSRLIFNKERDSYMGTMQTAETVVQQSGGLFSAFRRRK